MIPLLLTARDTQEAIRNAAQRKRKSLGWSQVELSERSGVSLGTLKRFERLGEVSLASLLALAEAMEALDAFGDLFPLPEAQTLDELDARQRGHRR